MMPQLPLLLALLGTALTAIAIFAAPRAVVAPTVSFAPPVAAPPAAAPPERWPALDERWPALDERWPPDGDEPTVLVAPEWPALIDPSAVRCDVVARLALVDALSAVRAPWAAAILRRAGDGEPDPQVRAAARTALGGWD